MDKAKITKMLVKGALGLTVSAAIGAMIKTEKSIGLKIDELWKNNQTPTDI
jgi:hypothetical protein